MGMCKLTMLFVHSSYFVKGFNRNRRINRNHNRRIRRFAASAPALHHHSAHSALIARRRRRSATTPRSLLSACSLLHQSGNVFISASRAAASWFDVPTFSSPHFSINLHHISAACYLGFGLSQARNHSAVLWKSSTMYSATCKHVLCVLKGGRPTALVRTLTGVGFKIVDEM